MHSTMFCYTKTLLLAKEIIFNNCINIISLTVTKILMSPVINATYLHNVHNTFTTKRQNDAKIRRLHHID